MDLYLEVPQTVRLDQVNWLFSSMSLRAWTIYSLFIRLDERLEIDSGGRHVFVSSRLVPRCQRVWLPPPTELGRGPWPPTLDPSEISDRDSDAASTRILNDKR